MTVAQTVARERPHVTEFGRPTAVDAEALTRLFRAHAPATRRFLLRLGVPTNEVDDVLQQVFMLAWRKLDTLRPDASERAWVLAFARRQAANVRRKVRRDRRAMVPPDPVTPEEHAVGHEAARLVREFLERLDEPRRIVFHLADVEGMTAPEIAEVEGVNLNTVYTRLRAARHAFREFVARRIEKGES